LVLRKTTTIARFQATAIETRNSAVFFGGELHDDCSQKGIAAVLKENSSGSAEIFWKDDTIFSSVVRGMAANNGISIVVNYERAIGIEIQEPIDFSTVLSDKKCAVMSATRNYSRIMLGIHA
jgi:hypothetical protein